MLTFAEPKSQKARPDQQQDNSGQISSPSLEPRTASQRLDGDLARLGFVNLAWLAAVQARGEAHCREMVQTLQKARLVQLGRRCSNGSCLQVHLSHGTAVQGDSGGPDLGGWRRSQEGHR